MFDKLKKKLRTFRVKQERKKVAKEIESGQRPRGRTPENIHPAYGNAVIIAHTELQVRHFRPDRNGEHKRSVKSFLFFDIKRRFIEIIEDRRIVLNRVVTTAFVNDIVDALHASAGPYGTFDDYKYHDSGTGTGDELVGNTGLGTPCGDARDTGTQVEGASANIYKSVATHTYDDTLAITEHGLFNASAVGTVMDRTKFAAINVVNLDQIEFTFQITFTAGG